MKFDGATKRKKAIVDYTLPVQGCWNFHETEEFKRSKIKTANTSEVTPMLKNNTKAANSKRTSLAKNGYINNFVRGINRR